MKVLLAAAAALVGASVANADAPGISASVSSAGLNYVTQTFIPVLEAAFANLNIPGTSGSSHGFDFSLANIQCGNLQIGSAGVTTDGAATVTVNGFALACSAAWSFKLHSWPHLPRGSGTVDISVSNTNAVLGVAIAADATMHPVVSVTSSTLNIGSIDLSFHGSLWDWLIDLFKGFVTNAVKNAVQSAFKNVIPTIVTNNINPRLAKIALARPLPVRAPYDIAEIRYGLVGNPVFTSSYMGFGLQGDIVPIANPVSPPIAPSQIPPWNSADGGSYLQGQLSSYTLMSALYLYYNAGLTQWLVDSSKIPYGLNKTSAYTLVAPGLPLAYPDSMVSLNVSFNGLPTVNFSAASGINITAPIAIEWVVTTNNGSDAKPFTLLANAGLVGAISIGNDANGTMALLGKVSYLGAELSVLQSSIGTVNVNLLNTLINFLFTDILVPTVNGIFSNGLPFPAVDGVSLTNTHIDFGDNFVTIGTNFVFNPALIGEMAAEAGVLAAQRQAVSDLKASAAKANVVAEVYSAEDNENAAKAIMQAQAEQMGLGINKAATNNKGGKQGGKKQTLRTKKNNKHE